MKANCGILRLAEKAFYRRPVGDGTTASGPTIHLARVLADCYGNIMYGINELGRQAKGSEMQAYAWDMQANVRSDNKFIVPHQRDKKISGKMSQVDLDSLASIYENNANAASRRLRGVILGLLPTWYVEEAIETCEATLAKGDGTPLADRVQGAVTAFGEFGVTQAQIERKLGKSIDKANQFDVARLMVVYRSIARGEIAMEDEFPPLRERVSLADLPAPAPAATPAPVAPVAAPEPTPEPKAAEPPAAPADTGVGPVADAYDYERVLAIAIESGLIPATARDSSARKVLLQAAAEATGREWGVLDDAIAAEGPKIVAHIRAKGAEQS
jgi:hypothetical protein